VSILVKFINVRDPLSPNQGVHRGWHQLSETSCFSTLLNGTAFAWVLSGVINQGVSAHLRGRSLI
jgi:hypothetical protein